MKKFQFPLVVLVIVFVHAGVLVALQFVKNERHVSSTPFVVRVIEPSGIKPSGFEPSGVQPSVIEPSVVQSLGIKPSGVQPSGVQPSGIEPSGIEPSSNTHRHFDANNTFSEFSGFSIVYPKRALQLGIEGQADVLIRFENGRQPKFEIVRSSGFEILDEAVREAMHSNEFLTMLRDANTNRSILFSIDFRLTRKNTGKISFKQTNEN